MAAAQRLGQGQAVDEEAVAAHRLIGQAVQELQARLQLSRGQVGVGRQVDGGIGAAIGIGLGLHVEAHAEIGLAHERDSLGQADHRVRLQRRPAHQGQAHIAHGGQPGEIVRPVRLQVHEVELGQGFGALGAPQDLGWAEVALGAAGLVIGVGAQPAGVIAAGVAVAPAHRQAAGVASGLRGGQILRRVDDLEGLFAGQAMHAQPARAVVAQPGEMERADAPVAPGHRDMVSGDLRCCDPMFGRKGAPITNGFHGGLALVCPLRPAHPGSLP